MRLMHIIQGVALTVCGAGVWLFLYLGKMYRGEDTLIVLLFCTFFGLLMSCIYVVPLGVTLGLMLPSFCERNSMGRALVGAVVLGTAVAALTTIAVSIVFVLKPGSVFRSMCPICVGLIFSWALWLKREQGRAEHRTNSPKA